MKSDKGLAAANAQGAGPLSSLGRDSGKAGRPGGR